MFLSPRSLAGLLILKTFASTALAGAAEVAARPHLQIINGSEEPMRVEWLTKDAERMSNGTLGPGEDKVITTTL